MTKEKDEIMAMKVAQLGVYDNTALAEGETKLAEGEQMPAQGEVQTIVDGVVQTADCRFSKLIEVDNFYKTYEPPAYNNDITLSGICEAYRNFACSRMHLYYDIKTIRLFIAGMATSCCPAWSVMAKKLFPTLAPYISMALTPMVLTARMLKKDDPDACIAFIGPCAAKKLEASRRTIRSDVDFVLTFEELMGMFNAKGVTFEDITDEEKVDLCEGTGDGRGFAVSGGVAKAVADVIHKLDPEREVKVVSAQGLKDCRKLLTLAKAGKYDGYLLEGMACPGGCVAGAGTLQAVEKSTALVNKYVKDAPLQNSLDSKYEINLDLITESHDDK